MEIKNTTFGILSVAAATTLALAACTPDEENGDTADDQNNEVQEDTNGADDTAEFEDDAADDAETDAADEPTEEETDDAAAEDDAAADDADQAGGEGAAYEAAEAVAEEYPEAVISQFEVESDEIEVDIFDLEGDVEVELRLDPETYEITSEEEDELDSDDRQKAEAVEIDFIEALQTAEQEGGAEPEDADLDDENGTVVWEIQLVDGTDVYIDVATGDVVESTDDDD